MRKFQSTISTLVSNVGNALVRQGNQLIVRDEVLRTLDACSLDALGFHAARLWPSVMTPCVRTALCFATVKQTTRRHDIACRHAAV